MPTSDYVRVLMKLHELVDISIMKVNEKMENSGLPIDVYRKRIADIFLKESQEYLDLLPNETREGAFVTLKDYGQRNREDILLQIERGNFPRVEAQYN